MKRHSLRFQTTSPSSFEAPRHKLFRAVEWISWAAAVPILYGYQILISVLQREIEIPRIRDIAQSGTQHEGDKRWGRYGGCSNAMNVCVLSGRLWWRAGGTASCCWLLAAVTGYRLTYRSLLWLLHLCFREPFVTFVSWDFGVLKIKKKTVVQYWSCCRVVVEEEPESDVGLWLVLWWGVGVGGKTCRWDVVFWL